VVGSNVENFIRDLSVDKAFLGADAVDIEHGITNATFSEVTIKQQIIESAKETFLVADHTKFGRTSLVNVADLRQVEYLITDNKIKQKTVNKLEKLGIWVEH